VIATATNTVTTITVGTSGSFPFGVAVSPDGSKVYVANNGDGSVSVIATATNTVTTTITVGTSGSGPFGVAVSPDGRKVYVANMGDGSVSVIDAATNAVTATITDTSFDGPLAFGVFIIRPSFAGTPRFSNCTGVSASALSIQYGGTLGAAAAALGFPSVQALQNAIRAFCGR